MNLSRELQSEEFGCRENRQDDVGPRRHGRISVLRRTVRRALSGSRTPEMWKGVCCFCYLAARCKFIGVAVFLKCRRAAEEEMRLPPRPVPETASQWSSLLELAGRASCVSVCPAGSWDRFSSHPCVRPF